MASYRVFFKPSVEKDLASLPKGMASRAVARIEGLAQKAFPPGSVKLSGAEGLFRLRMGDYRIVYEVDSKMRVVTVHYVRHRREVYRGL